MHVSFEQVSQFILDDYIMRGEGSLCRIVCTQPRRISAISVCYILFYHGFLFSTNQMPPLEVVICKRTPTLNK